MLKRSVLAVAVLLSLCACGKGSASCDFRDAEPRCQERVETLDTTGFKATCDAAGGKSADGLCPRDGIVAGCVIGDQSDGSEVIDWFYAPKSQTEVKTACDNAGNELRNP